MPTLIITNDDKFVFNLHNDYALAGTWLEGYDTPEYAKFLLKLIHSMESSSPALFTKVRKLEPHLTTLAIKSVGSLAERAKTDRDLTFCSGWNGTEDYSGHSIIAEMIEEDDGGLQIILYNTGDGLSYHTRELTPEGRFRYSPTKIYKIDKKHNNEQVRSAIFSTLSKYLEEPITPKDSDLSPSTVFYMHLEELMIRLDAVEEFSTDKSLFVHGQRAGTCSWKVITAFMKQELDQKSYRQFKYEAKLTSLQDYFNKIKTSERIQQALIQEQLLKACQNLARMLDKYKDGDASILNSKRVEAGLNLITEIEEQIQKLRSETTATISDVAFSRDGLEMAKIAVKPITGLDVSTTKSEATPVIANLPASNTKIPQKLVLNLKKFITDESIDPLFRLIGCENFLLDMQLEKLNFTSSENPYDKIAVETCLNNISKIAEEYEKLCKKFPGVHTESVLAALQLNLMACVYAGEFLRADKYTSKSDIAMSLLWGIFADTLATAKYTRVYLDPKQIINLANIIIQCCEKFLIPLLQISAKSEDIDNIKALILKLKSGNDIQDSTDQILKIVEKHFQKELSNTFKKSAIDELITVFNPTDLRMDPNTAKRIYAFFTQDMLPRIKNICSLSISSAAYDNAYMVQNMSGQSGSDLISTARADVAQKPSEKTEKLNASIKKLVYTETNGSALPTTLVGEYGDWQKNIATELELRKYSLTQNNEIIFFLAKMYTAKDTMLAAIYDFVTMFPDKLAITSIQDIIYINLFKDSHIYKEAQNNPQGIAVLLELLSDKFNIYYNHESLNSISIFTLKLIISISTYLLELPDELRNNNIIKEVLERTQNKFAVLDSLITKYPQNIELRKIQITALKQKFSKGEEPSIADVIDILSCFLCVNSNSYIVNGKECDPWLSRSEILELMIQQDFNIKSKLDDPTARKKIFSTLISNLYGLTIEPTAEFKGDYPYFTCTLPSGQDCSINLMTGDFKIASKQFRQTPPDIVRSPIYKHHFQDRLFWGQTLNLDTFEFEDKARDIEYIFRKNNQSYELLRFFDLPNSHTIYKYLEDNSFLQQQIPETMLNSEYAFWSNESGAVIVTDHITKEPLYYLTTDKIIDCKNNFELLKYDQASDNNFIKNIFTFEAAKFVEIWRSPTEPYKYMVKLPRYKQAFVSNDGINFIWQQDPRYKLAAAKPSDLMHGFNNFLLLEAVDGNSMLDKIVITPQQDMMLSVDRKEIILDVYDEQKIRADILDTADGKLLPNDTNLNALIYAKRRLQQPLQKYTLIPLKGNELAPHTVESYLHLAYIYLCNDQTELAIQMLNQSIPHFRGTTEQIGWLGKIVSSLPEFVALTKKEQMIHHRAALKSANQMAVKATAAYLLALYPQSLAKLDKKQRAMLTSNATICVNKYLDTLRNIPDTMRLNEEQTLLTLQEFGDSTTTQRLAAIRNNLDPTQQDVITYDYDISGRIMLDPECLDKLPIRISELLAKRSKGTFVGRKDLTKIDLDSDYSVFIDSILNVMQIILSSKEPEISELLAHLDHMTKIFFNPRRNHYEYLDQLNKYDADTIRGCLVLLNYMHKFANNLQFALPRLQNLPSIPIATTEKPNEKSYQIQTIVDALQQLLKDKSELIYLSYNVAKSHEAKDLPTIATSFARRLPTPTGDAPDSILSDMFNLCAKASVKLPEVKSTEKPRKSFAGSFKDIMRDDFTFDCKVAEEKLKDKRNAEQPLLDQFTGQNLSKLLDEAQQASNSLSESLLGAEDVILNQANMINPEDEEFATIAFSAKYKHHLSIPEILKLYLLQDFSKYQELTFLNDQQIIDLQQKVFNYLLQVTRLQHMQRLIKVLQNLQISTDHDKTLALQSELASLLMARRNYKPEDNPGMLLLEHYADILIRGEQAKYFAALTNNESDAPNTLAHIIMGGGKSKVILPLLAQKKANGQNLAIVVVSKSMYETNLHDLRDSSAMIFGQRCYEFVFTRDTDITDDYFKKLYFKLLEVIKNSDYILSTPESLQSLDLKLIELLNMPDTLQTKVQDIFFLRQILKLIKEKGAAIIDEIDQNLLTKDELIYGVGLRRNIGQTYQYLAQDAVKFYQFLQEHHDVAHLIGGQIVLLTDTEKNTFIKQVAESLLHKEDSILLSILRSDINFTELNTEDIQDLKEYLCKFESALPEFLRYYTAETLERISYIRANLSGLLSNTLTMHLDEHYGLSYKEADPIKSNIAVPYSASKTPAENSEYSAIFKQINCTIQAHWLIDLKYDIFIMLIEYFSSRYVQASAISVTQAQAVQNEFEALTRLRDIKLSSILLEKESLNKLYERIKNLQVVKAYALTNFVLPYILFNTESIHSNPQKFMRMFHNLVGITGTPYNYRTLTPMMQYDPSLSLGTDGITVANIRTNTFDIHKLTKQESLDEMFDRLKVKEKVHALIDQGAYFRDFTNEQMANHLRIILAETSIKYILYFDSNELHCLSVDPEIPELDYETLQESLKLNPEIFFTYYDQKHATGVDIKQTHDAHALLTISETTTIRDLLQAAMRMRNLSHGNRLEIVVPAQISHVIENVDDIIEYCLNHQIEQLADDHLMAAKQKIMAVIADDLLNILLDTKHDIARLQQIFQTCKDMFINKVAISLFDQYGQQLSQAPVAEVLRAFANSQLHIWREALQSLHLYTEDAEHKLSDTVNEIIASSITICRPTVYTGHETYFDDQQVQQQQQEQQAEQQLQQERKDEKELASAIPAFPLTFSEQDLTEILNSEFSKHLASKQGDIEHLYSLNFVFDSMELESEWKFNDNVYLSYNFFRVEGTQKNILQFKREVSQILVVYDPENDKEFYVAVTDEDAANIRNFCMANKSLLSKHLILRTIHGYSSFEHNPYTGELAQKQPPSLKDVLQQYALFNGDIDILARNPTWLYKDFASKAEFAKKLMKIHNVIKIKMLPILEQLNPAARSSSLFFTGYESSRLSQGLSSAQPTKPNSTGPKISR